jgi:hypothetical protein
VLVVLSSTFSACAKEEAQPTDALPPYCATQDGGPDAKFWRLVEQSAAWPLNGDVAQARALRLELSGLDAEQIAAFRRTFVRVNNALYTGSRSGGGPSLCAGDRARRRPLHRLPQLGHRTRSIGLHARCRNPEKLNDSPDIANGCGLGERFGYAVASRSLSGTSQVRFMRRASFMP